MTNRQEGRGKHPLMGVLSGVSHPKAKGGAPARKNFEPDYSISRDFTRDRKIAQAFRRNYDNA
jgi:hypothetical protein